MKIVHVLESLDIGGLERVVLSLAAWQQARGDEVCLICLFHEGPWAAEARALGIEVIAIGKRRGLDVRAMRSLRRALHTRSADVLHTHNAVAHYYTAGAGLGLGAVRLINTRHGMGEARGSARLELLYRLAMRRAHCGVAVCRAARQRFLDIGAFTQAKAVVVPNGVAITGAAARSLAARQQMLAGLGRPPSPLVIGAVGRLSAVKDHAMLLHAVQRLRHSGRDVELVVLGDGRERAALQALAQTLQIQPHVHLVGWRHDVSDWLQGFDVFAMPSVSEGYALALVEAAAAALPLVATAVGGNGEIVQQGVTGMLVPARDSDAFAAALAQLVDNAALRADMGQAARQWALAHGSIGTMGAAYQALYEERA
jgi:glycosyltransferase involved in cell wall biosynthesis